LDRRLPVVHTPHHDSVHNVQVGGLIAVELLPRFYCAVRVAFGWPARIQLVWRLAASIVQRRWQ
jgi:hypothetical protein